MTRNSRWKLDKSNWTLLHIGTHYEIDLETITTSAQLADWIFQVSRKTWATTEDRSDLLEAFQEILNPQETLCPFGMSRELDATRFLAKRFTSRLVEPAGRDK